MNKQGCYLNILAFSSAIAIYIAVKFYRLDKEPLKDLFCEVVDITFERIKT